MEDLAIALNRYYLERSKDDKNFQDERVIGISASCRKLLEKAKEIDPNGNDLGARAKLTEQRAITSSHLATSLIQVAVINTFRDLKLDVYRIASPIDIELLKFSVELLDELTTGKNSNKPIVIETRLMRMHSDAGKRILSLKLESSIANFPDIDELYDGIGEAELEVFDHWRFIAHAKRLRRPRGVVAAPVQRDREIH
ncbi:hypothetical protein [Roseovarius aestuarii]|uniref:hypothetical protein n=1 Tax=Roseovarius aestuarii TaxID=475083 RepID=UPI00111BD732|nr:hypothetical protein [Roseovarius aestuarii]